MRIFLVTIRKLLMNKKNIQFFSSFLFFLFIFFLFYYSVICIGTNSWMNTFRYLVFVKFYVQIIIGIQKFFINCYYLVFGIRKFFMKEALRSSVFRNFSQTKIFGLQYSEIFHERRYSVFGLRKFFMNEDLLSSVFRQLYS